MTEMGAVESAQGEDRSSYQDVVPWTADDFGFTKATEATGWTDPTFAANWANLRAEGKPRGAYHFFHPSISATAQADFFLSFVRANGGLEPGDMLMIDTEITVGADGIEVFSDPAQAGLRSNVPPSGTLASPALVDSGTLTFLETVRSSLVHPERHPLVVYTNLSVGSLLTSCTQFNLFIAYPSLTAPPSVAPWPNWRFWQWEFGGGPGGGDRDAYNGTQAALMAWLDTFKSATVVAPPGSSAPPGSTATPAQPSSPAGSGS